jgi:hypothetical protein
MDVSSTVQTLCAAGLQDSPAWTPLVGGHATTHGAPVATGHAQAPSVQVQSAE